MVWSNSKLSPLIWSVWLSGFFYDICSSLQNFVNRWLSMDQFAIAPNISSYFWKNKMFISRSVICGEEPDLNIFSSKGCTSLHLYNRLCSFFYCRESPERMSEYTLSSWPYHSRCCTVPRHAESFHRNVIVNPSSSCSGCLLAHPSYGISPLLTRR